MAVKVSNINNSRKSRMWSEQDDAQLGILLKRKIKDTTVAIRESETPYERSRLKSQRIRYKEMLHKVESGAYNGDIIFNELRASAAMRQEASLSAGLHSSMAGGKAYTNAYGNVDFDYEAAFRKKRYYGVALPIIMTLITIVMIASVILGAFSPSLIDADTTEKITKTTTLNINSLFVYRLGEREGEVFDIGVKADNNGNWWWPEANYALNAPEQNKPYVDSSGVVHDSEGEIVYLYEDLGCTEIYIDAVDVVKAWFKTKMLEKTRIDILEDLSIFQGQSYYYALLLSGTKANELIIKKNDEGNYDFGIIYNHIGVYGTILFLLITIILMTILLIQNLVRIFTYTSRRMHVTTWLCLIFSALTMISPAFATCEGTDLGTSFSNYFMALTNAKAFSESLVTTVGVSLMALIPLALSVILLILPKLFKNRHKSMPTHIPKGNKNIHI